MSFLWSDCIIDCSDYFIDFIARQHDGCRILHIFSLRQTFRCRLIKGSALPGSCRLSLFQTAEPQLFRIHCAHGPTVVAALVCACAGAGVKSTAAS